MDIISEIIELVGKVYLLYVVIASGYIFGKRTQYGRKQLAIFIIYVTGPLVIFHGAATAPDNNNVFAVPILSYVLCSLLAFISLRLGQHLWTRSDKPDVLAFVGGTANMGSFGIPMVLAFFGEAGVSVAIYSAMANIVFENTIGYYLLIRHGSAFRAAIMKVIALPAIYAFAFGVAVNAGHYSISPAMADLFGGVRLLYIGCGMFLIGMSLADVRHAKLDAVFTGAVFGIKFLIFPAIMLTIMTIDSRLTHIFDAHTRDVLLFLSVMPSGSNIIAFATRLHKYPELVGFTVLTTTLFALVYIPVFAAIFL